MLSAQVEPNDCCLCSCYDGEEILMFKVEHVSETLNCYQLSSTAAQCCVS